MEASLLAYESLGSGEPSFVLIHGFASNRRFFDPLATALADGARVITLDLRGHGESGDDTRPHTFKDLADDVAMLAGQLDLRDFVVVGHSMGGALALEVAAQYPALVRAAVLLDPVFVIMSPAAREGFVALADFFATDDWADVLAAMVRGGVLDTDRMGVERVQDMISACCRTPHAVVAETAREIAAWNGEKAGERCQCPVLHVSASSVPDAFGGSAQQTKRIADIGTRFPHWHTGQVVGAGHLAMLERTDQLVPMIRRFVELSDSQSG